MSSQALPNSDVEAGVALSRSAPSGPRSLTPVVLQTRLSHIGDRWGVGVRLQATEIGTGRRMHVDEQLLRSDSACPLEDCAERYR
jgi:hypothetical protein